MGAIIEHDWSSHLIGTNIPQPPQWVAFDGRNLIEENIPCPMVLEPFNATQNR